MLRGGKQREPQKGNAQADDGCGVNPTRAQFDSHVVNPAIVYTKRDVARLLAKTDMRDVSESVRPDLGPCWFWTASKTDEGYPRVGFQGKVAFAHRLIYLMTKGDLSNGLQADHQCEVASCVNPSHLQAATARMNTLRSRKIPSAINSRKTQCPKGHALTGDNVIIDNTRGREPGRRCRVYKNDYQRKRWKQWKDERERKQAA